MDNYIALLFLVMPGYIARKIYKHTSDVREDLSAFEETMYCLLNSSLIVLVLFGFIAVAGIQSYSVLEEYFDNTFFIVGYGITALILACILGLCTEWLRGKYNAAINWRRRKKGMALLSISQDVLDEMLLTDGMAIKLENGSTISKFIEVYKDDKMIARGGLKVSNIKHREFILEDCEKGLNYYLDTYKEMPPVKKAYVDGRLGLTIKEYDLSNLMLKPE